MRSLGLPWLYNRFDEISNFGKGLELLLCPFFIKFNTMEGSEMLLERGVEFIIYGGARGTVDSMFRPFIGC